MFKYLLEKEFKQIMRNKFLPRMILLFPVISLLVFPLAVNMEVKNVALAVVDQDHTEQSQLLINKIAASGYFQIVNDAPHMQNAMGLIENHKADIILEIPYGLGKRIANNEVSSLQISANAVDATKGGIGSSYLVSIVNDFNTDIAMQNSPARPAAVEIESSFMFNPMSSYTVFMVPALMVMLLTMICGFMPALNIVGEKESGSIEQMNVTPVNRYIFILGKLIPYWIIGMIVITSGFLVARLFYGLIPLGALGVIYLFAMLYILAISGFGLIISNTSETMQQAMFVMYFFMLIFILLSGLFTPISSMPECIQYITRINPLSYFIQVMRAVYLKGTTLAELTGPLVALSVFALLFNSIAVLTYKKSA